MLTVSPRFQRRAGEVGADLLESLQRGEATLARVLYDEWRTRFSTDPAVGCCEAMGRDEGARETGNR